MKAESLSTSCYDEALDQVRVRDGLAPPLVMEAARLVQY